MDESYSTPVVLNESCRPFSPSICGAFRFADASQRRPVQPTCNTIVVAASIEPTWRTAGVRSSSPASASTNGHSRRDMCTGWCCTFVARAAYEAAGRPGNEARPSAEALANRWAAAFRPREQTASEHYTWGSVVTQGTK